MSAFALFGHRPQFFTRALGEVLNPLNEPKAGFENFIFEAAKTHISDEQARMESQYQGLRLLERAIIWRLLEQGGKFRPYDAEALKFYTEKTAAK